MRLPDAQGCKGDLVRYLRFAFVALSTAYRGLAHGA